MPDDNNNSGGSLVLDFTKWWRHVQPKNFANTTLTIWSYKVLSNVFFLVSRSSSSQLGTPENGACSIEFQVRTKPL